MEPVHPSGDPATLSDLKRRQMLKLGMLTAGVGAFLALPQKAHAKGYATSPNVINVKDNGAVGNGIASDTKAVRDSVLSAIKSLTDRTDKNPGIITVYFPPGRYRITDTIAVDFKGKGRLVRQGIRFKGDGAAIFLDGALNEWAFRLELDYFVTHESFFSFTGFWFYTLNGSNRMNAIHSDGACGLTIQDCVFDRVWMGLQLTRGTNVRVNGCQFIGCYLGAELFRCRDSLVFNCYSHSATLSGFFLHGIHDHGTDGGVKIDQCISIGGYGGADGSCIGIWVLGIYSPMITNIISEHNSVNLRVESCQYGILSNLFSGPSRISVHFGRALRYPGPVTGINSYAALPDPGRTTLSNAEWNIQAVNFQTEMELEALQLSKAEGLVCRDCRSSLSGAVITIKGGFEVEVNAMLREIGDSVPLAMKVCNDSYGVKITGGLYEKKIRFEKGRIGNNLLNSPHVYQDIEFEGGVQDGEAGVYYLKDERNIAFEKKIAYNQILPSCVYSETLPKGKSADLPFLGELNFPNPGESGIIIARFVITGRHPGSVTAAEVSVTRTGNAVRFSVLNGTGSGSFRVETTGPSASGLRFRNESGTLPATVRVNLLDLKVLTA